MKISKLFNSIAAATVLVASFATVPASAYTLTNAPNCAVAAAVFDPAYDNCVGAYDLDPGENDVTDGAADNIVNLILNGDNVFGADDWTFLDKIDSNGNTTGYVTTTGLNSTSGSLTIADFGQAWPIEIAVSFKAAGNFSIYYWSALAGPPGTIDWSTAGTATNKNGNVQGLSHASVYYRHSSVTVPEPGALALFGIGLLGLGFASRRRTAI